MLQYIAVYWDDCEVYYALLDAVGGLRADTKRTENLR